MGLPRAANLTPFVGTESIQKAERSHSDRRRYERFNRKPIAERHRSEPKKNPRMRGFSLGAKQVSNGMDQTF